MPHALGNKFVYIMNGNCLFHFTVTWDDVEEGNGCAAIFMLIAAMSIFIFNKAYDVDVGE